MAKRALQLPLKTAVYQQIARIGQAASSPGRLELLDLLSQGPRAVEVLAKLTGQSVANTSHHLQVLRRVRLVEAEKAGVRVTYRLADPRVERFFVDLRQLAELRLAEIAHVARQYYEERGALERVDNRELIRRVRAGQVTLIDVRPSEEYEAAHIPGAISVPLSELPKRLQALRKTRDVVAYCRGPYCVMSLDAVGVLRRRGFRAHRLSHGVSEWRSFGWPVESGDIPRAVGRR